MSPHVDILDQRERLAPSFVGSIAFHILLVATIIGVGYVQSKSTISLGDPNGGRLGAVTVNPVASIALPSHSGPKNPVATDTESAVPVPVSKAKPAPKVKVPDAKAIPIPSRNAKTVTRPSEAASERNKWREQQKDLPNQVYSTAGTHVATPDFALAGGGGVGVGTNSPFGNQFGAYADLLRNRVAEKWSTSGIRANSAPIVGVTFVLHRDGSATNIRITQKSGISALDISAQRAVMDAAPFPQLPPAFPKNEAEIEFLFKLKQ